MGVNPLGRRRRLRKLSWIILLLFLLAGIWWGAHLVDRCLRPVLMSVARNKVRGLGTTLISEVLRETARSIDYEDLIAVHTTADGYVSYMMPDGGAIMDLVGAVGEKVQRRLDNMASHPLEIPAGQLSGISMLSNTGPTLPIDMLPRGAAQVGITEEFTGVGINHVKHTIFLAVHCDMLVIAPLVQNHLEVSVKLPVAEAIIVGPVPDMYVPLGAFEYSSPES